jgi:hypothetical protein
MDRIMAALLRKLSGGRTFPIRGQTCPAIFATGMQGAESPVWNRHVQPLRDAHRVACRRAVHHAKG